MTLCAALTAQGRNVSGGALIAEQACSDVLPYALVLDVDPKRRASQGRVGECKVGTEAPEVDPEQKILIQRPR